MNPPLFKNEIMTREELTKRYGPFYYARRPSWPKYRFLSFVIVYQPMIINGGLEFVWIESWDEDSEADDWEHVPALEIDGVYIKENSEFMKELERVTTGSTEPAESPTS